MIIIGIIAALHARVLVVIFGLITAHLADDAVGVGLREVGMFAVHALEDIEGRWGLTGLS